MESCLRIGDHSGKYYCNTDKWCLEKTEASHKFEYFCKVNFSHVDIVYLIVVSAYTLWHKAYGKSGSEALTIENRQRIRINPEGLTALISIKTPNKTEVMIDGQVIDMSYGGIKIRLRQPFSQLPEEAELRITLVLPESGVPVSIHGQIKHLLNQCECGLEYGQQHSESEFDDLMFECVKMAPHVSQ